MEITGEIRTEMIELVRAARTIVDTGWPRDLEADVNDARMEDVLRANMINTVAGHLLYLSGRSAAENLAPAGAMQTLIETIRGTFDDVRETSRQVVALVQKIDEIMAVVGRLSEVVQTLSDEMRSHKNLSEGSI